MSGKKKKKKKNDTTACMDATVIIGVKRLLHTNKELL